MPTTDEDVLRDLLHASLDDLALAPGRTHAILTRQRRRELRRRSAAVGVTGVAAAVALAVVTDGGPAAHARPPVAGSAHAPAVHLTSGQVVLDALAAKAAAQPATGRYAVFVEDRAPIKETTVYDSLTGDLWIYQEGGGAPPVLTEKHGSPTSAQLAAELPTNLAALRTFLISDANADRVKAEAVEAKAARIKGGKGARPAAIAPRTDNEKVFEQAIEYLYNPLVPAPQRSALFRLLAETPGVQVNPHARDSLGRPAIALRDVTEDPGVPSTTTTVYEDPATTRPLEEDFGSPEFGGQDIFNSITFTSTRPADPYRNQ
jgi:hypothetical protein